MHDMTSQLSDIVRALQRAGAWSSTNEALNGTRAHERRPATIIRDGGNRERGLRSGHCPRGSTHRISRVASIEGCAAQATFSTGHVGGRARTPRVVSGRLISTGKKPAGVLAGLWHDRNRSVLDQVNHKRPRFTPQPKGVGTRPCNGDALFSASADAGRSSNPRVQPPSDARQSARSVAVIITNRP
jgi:hypothetical protein